MHGYPATGVAFEQQRLEQIEGFRSTDKSMHW